MKDNVYSSHVLQEITIVRKLGFRFLFSITKREYICLDTVISLRDISGGIYQCGMTHSQERAEGADVFLSAPALWPSARYISHCQQD